MRINHLAFSLKIVTLLVSCLFPWRLPAGSSVEYDRGEKKRERQFVSAENCTHNPCTITQWGAIRLSHRIARTHLVQMGALHRGMFTSIALFQESTTFEQQFSERIFNRKPNRKIVNLERLIETGGADTIYIYGLLLQYELDEADIIELKLTSLKNPTKVEEYFFRYHHDGAKFDVDIAFVQPLNLFAPNPGGVIQAAYSTVALSFSVARAMDPDKQYRLAGKMIRAVRFNVISGLLLRKDVFSFNGDNITKDYFDGFGGVGLTFFDFFAVGYGGNFVRSPHTTFPFVGLEIRHLMEFLRTLKTDTHTRWQRYLKEEMAHQNR